MVVIEIIVSGLIIIGLIIVNIVTNNKPLKTVCCFFMVVLSFCFAILSADQVIRHDLFSLLTENTIALGGKNKFIIESLVDVSDGKVIDYYYLQGTIKKVSQ